MPNLLSQLTKDAQAQFREVGSATARATGPPDPFVRSLVRERARRHPQVARGVDGWRDGAVARAGTRATADRHWLLSAEYAYLTDRKHKRAGNDWKSLRKAKAASVLRTIARIAPPIDRDLVRTLP